MPTELQRWCWDVSERYQPDGGPAWFKVAMSEILDLLKGLCAPRLLDVGCGARNMLSPYFAEHLAFRVGLDLDPAVRGNVCLDSLVRADACHIPLRDESMDVVLSGYLLEHLRCPIEALREIHRVLKPGGTAFLWTVNLFNYAILASALTPTRFHNWMRHRAFPECESDNCPTWYRANTPAAFLHAICGAGLVPQGSVRFGAGSFQYWRFSRPLFVAAVRTSHLIALTPLRGLMNVMFVRCVRPAV